MRFGWDPPKNDRNVQERGLPFTVAMTLFDRPTLEVDDTRRDYGERRNHRFRCRRRTGACLRLYLAR